MNTNHQIALFKDLYGQHSRILSPVKLQTLLALTKAQPKG